MAITLTGITGLSDLVIDERQGGNALITPAIIGSSSIVSRSNLNYPQVTASAVKPFNFDVNCVLTQSKLDLLQSYYDAQEYDGERGNILIQNTEFSITATQLAAGNRTQVGSTIATTGIDKYHYQFYGVLVFPGDYFSTLSLGSNSLGARYEVSFTVEELWD